MELTVVDLPTVDVDKATSILAAVVGNSPPDNRIAKNRRPWRL
ncbi:MAG: hypothetical protein ACYC1C_11100 [Chloroflexota bacterium]